MPSIGYHDVTINSHFWGTTSKGNVQLCVGVTFASGESMTGYVYFTPATCRSPGLRDDGAPKRSMAERALNALGYDGDPRNAQRQIGPDDLVDNVVRAHVVKQDEKYGGGVKINGFYEAVQRAEPEIVNKELDRLFDLEQQPADGWDDDEDDTPPEPPHLKPGDRGYDVPTKEMMDEADAEDAAAGKCPKCGAVDAKKPMDHQDTCPDYAPF